MHMDITEADGEQGALVAQSSQNAVPETYPKATGERKAKPIMGTAARRRFKKALESGLTREEAIIKAKSGTVEPKGTHKRSYKEVLESVKMGITPKNLSERPLTEDEMTRIRETIVSEVEEKEEDGIYPEFEKCVAKAGWLLLHCSNEVTAKWVTANFAKIQKKCGLEVELVDQDNLPKSYIINGWFPVKPEMETQRILRKIAKQCPVPAQTWTLISRETDTKGKTPLEHLVLGVDEASWKALEQRQGLISFELTKVRLQLGKKRNSAAIEAEAKTAPSEEEAGPSKKRTLEAQATTNPTAKAQESTAQGKTEQTKVLKTTEKPGPAAKLETGKPKKTPGPSTPKAGEKQEGVKRNTRTGARATLKQNLITTSLRRTNDK